MRKSHFTPHSRCILPFRSSLETSSSVFRTVVKLTLLKGVIRKDFNAKRSSRWNFSPWGTSFTLGHLFSPALKHKITQSFRFFALAWNLNIVHYSKWLTRHISQMLLQLYCIIKFLNIREPNKCWKTPKIARKTTFAHDSRAGSNKRDFSSECYNIFKVHPQKGQST